MSFIVKVTDRIWYGGGSPFSAGKMLSVWTVVHCFAKNVLNMFALSWELHIKILFSRIGGIMVFFESPMRFFRTEW